MLEPVSAAAVVVFCRRARSGCRVGAVAVLCVASLLLAAERCCCAAGFYCFDTALNSAC